MQSNLPYTPAPRAGEVPTQYAWDSTKPTISQTREAAISSIQQNFAAIAAGSAPLAYVPLAGGVAMTGLFSLFANAATAMQPVTYQQLQSYLAANNGVVTFNTRAGAVTLTAADVNAALGFAPANAGGQTFSGNIICPVVQAQFFAQTQFVITGGGNFGPDANYGQSWLITLNANAIITGSGAGVFNIPAGSIMRLMFNLGIYNVTSWPANVKWPGGVAPALNAGTEKRAIVVLENVDGATLLATSAVY